MPFKFNAARRHRIPRARYRVRNWPAYEAGLKRRGDLTLWIDEAALDKWQAPRRNTPGGQAIYSDLAIEMVLMLRMVFHLALRQAEAFAGSVLRLLGLDLCVPDHTTLSRRSGEFCHTAAECDLARSQTSDRRQHGAETVRTRRVERGEIRPPVAGRGASSISRSTRAPVKSSRTP